ncbi:alpha/beta fold hydrolase [Mycobacterium sp. 1081908.1]|uniref:alpha/beta fold hydrolase n=1 Tax=Mycobacterium sp. 1081908.1 TaxID=1834066 RepID=UPI000AA2671C|nr:hypothetical protein [Mycobacterium sp. 1081908.1]
MAVLEAALITAAFRRIVLYEPPMPTPGHQVGAPDVCARLKAMSDPRQILHAFYRETLHLAPSAVEDLSKRELPYLADSIRHTAARELAAASAYCATGRLAGIGVPVRILFGTESPGYFRAAAETLAARIPGATTVALRGQGHQAIDYDPRQFASAVMEFDTPDVYPIRVAASVPPSS